MSRKCSICIHKKRKKIDELILKGDSFRTLSSRFKCSESAIKRHTRNGHVSQKLIKAEGAKDLSDAEDIMKKVQTLEEKANKILDRADSKESDTVALNAIREIREVLKLYAQLAGQLQGKSIQQVNIFMNPQYILLKQILIEELKDCPEQRKKISKRLEDAERTGTGD